MAMKVLPRPICFSPWGGKWSARSFIQILYRMAWTSVPHAGAPEAVIDSNAKCNGLVEGNFGIDIELCQEGLDRGFEVEAFSWGEVVHQHDVLKVLVGHFVDVEFSRQVPS